MNLSNAGAIAAQSLATISNQISGTSRNISGANTPGYSARLARLATNDLGAAVVMGFGRATDAPLFRNLLSANAAQGSTSVLSNALADLDRALGISSGSATDIASSGSPAARLAALSRALQAYSATPSNDTAGQQALAAAKDLARSLREATASTQQTRQQADQQIGADVKESNDILTRFQVVNAQIVSGAANGADVTDALDERDQLLNRLSQLIGVTTVTRPNNDMVIYTDSGATLFETTPRAVTFQPNATLTPGGSGASVYIDGVAATGPSASPHALHSGEIAGLAQLRDATAPQFQSQLDEIARGLVVAFAEQDQSGGGGPPLPGVFTYAGATGVPGPTLTPGLAGQIEINANVDPAQGGVLTRLRDGGVSGNTNYVYNTSGGVGYSDRLLQLANAGGAQQNFDPVASLGTTSSLASFAAGSIGWLGAQRQQADDATTYQDAVVTQTTQALSNKTGVNVDDQMSQMLALENSYQASAKLLEAINSMFTTLFSAIHA